MLQSSANSPAHRFEVGIDIPKKDIEVWDSVPNAIYVMAGYLCVTDKMVRDMWVHKPPVHRIVLECQSLHPPAKSPSSHFHPSPLRIAYLGQDIFEDQALSLLGDAEGILLNRRWARNYTDPGLQTIEWRIKFWIPIPMSAFDRIEERMLRLSARVTFQDSGDRGRPVAAHAETVLSISSLKSAQYFRKGN